MTYSDLFNDLPDLGFKTHVQHPVSFVQNKIRTPLKKRRI